MNLILQRQRLLLLDRPAASGYRHLSAASGLVQVGETLYVIGDDEVHLAAFSITGDAPGRLIRLFSGSLPRERDRRKAAKPDLELLLALPVGRDRPYGALLTIGSGSTRQRQRGAIAVLNAAGDVVKVSALDLSRLFRTIASVVDEVNVEGAALLGNRLILLNRGSTSYPDTVVLGLDLISTLEGGTPSILFRRTLSLHYIEGIPLGITDACTLDDGALVFSAVAEDTGNAYEDGRCLGAAIGMLDDDFNVVQLELVKPVVKIEGINAWRTSTGFRFLAVTDADAPSVAASLFEGSARF